jgi:hypothetical protein
MGNWKNLLEPGEPTNPLIEFTEKELLNPARYVLAIQQIWMTLKL